MRNRMVRNVALIVGAALLNSGCILSQSVDRNYLGVYSPAEESDRKLTGLFLLPFATVLDVVTLPVQAAAVLTYGDDYPYKYKGKGSEADPQNMNRVSPAQPTP